MLSPTIPFDFEEFPSHWSSLVFANGKWNSGHSQIHEGIKVQENVDNHSCNINVFQNSCLAVNLKEGANISFEFDIAEKCHAQIVMYSEASTAHSSSQDTDTAIAVAMGAESKVAWYSLRSENRQESTTHTYNLNLGSSARFRGFYLDGGGQRHLTRIESVSEGSNSDIGIFGLSLVHGQNHSGMNCESNLRHPSSRSNHVFKSIVEDQAIVAIRTKVHIAEAAQLSESSQINKNLLLSPEGKIETQPELEVFADNVKANHGATVGQIDATQLFYLRSRGFSLGQAKAALSRAFVDELLLKMDKSWGRDWMERQMNNMFQVYESHLIQRLGL